MNRLNLLSFSCGTIPYPFYSCIENHLSRFCRSLLNTYQGKRAFRPNSLLNSYEVGKRGGRFSLRSMRPNSFMNVYSTAGPKQRRSDPSLAHFEESEEDDDDNVVEEEFAEQNEVRSNPNFTMCSD